MRVLIIGLGSIAQKHRRILLDLKPDTKFLALRSAVDAAEQEGITNVFSLEGIVDKVDFVIISNPTKLHFEYINALCKFGKPLFIEKPPIHTLERATFLAERVKDAKIINYVACNLRFHPGLNFIKKYLNSSIRRINEVNVYCGSYLPDWRSDVDFRQVYSANSAMGGGVHLDLFHEIDYVYWLFGNPKKSVSVKSKVSSIAIDAFDYANYILSYDNFNASIMLNYYRRHPKRTIEILFDNDTWTLDLIKNEINSDKKGLIYNEKFDMLQTYRLQMEYFLHCIDENKMPMNTLMESIDPLTICLTDDL